MDCESAGCAVTFDFPVATGSTARCAWTVCANAREAAAINPAARRLTFLAIIYRPPYPFCLRWRCVVSPIVSDQMDRHVTAKWRGDCLRGILNGDEPIA